MGTFRIFCVNKKRTKPAGWFDPEGEPEHFSKAESARQSRCPPTLKLWRTSRHRGAVRALLSSLTRSSTVVHSLVRSPPQRCGVAESRSNTGAVKKPKKEARQDFVC